MRFGVRSLLIFVAICAIGVVATRYALELDGLTLLIVAANALLLVVLPGTAIGVAIGIWKRNRSLFLISAGTFGVVLGLIVGFATTMLYESASEWLLVEIPIESVAILLSTTGAIAGLAVGYILGMRIWRYFDR
jgi:hypothetical protein